MFQYKTRKTGHKGCINVKSLCSYYIVKSLFVLSSCKPKCFSVTGDPLHLHVFIWQMLLSKEYKWGTTPVTVDQGETFENNCLNTQLRLTQVPQGLSFVGRVREGPRVRERMGRESNEPNLSKTQWRNFQWKPALIITLALKEQMPLLGFSIRAPA